MKSPRVLLVLLVGFVGLGILQAAASPDLSWPQPTRENKPWTRWWWLGSAVDRTNLTRELEAIAAAGFGGVEITPIYGAKGAEERYLPFLSPSYLAMLAHVGAEAKRLGLGVDMATGTGWPFGGPQVTPANAELKIAFGADGKIAPVPTRFKVKRAAPGAEGLVLNPYSPTAMTHYLAPFTQALTTLPAGTIHGQFHDSFEYQANWAGEVPEKFLSLHGYDLREHAAALNDQGDPDTIARIKADYRTTLGALHLAYIQRWVEWAHALGQTTRNQAHGAPGNLLDLYAAADIPETEIFGSIPFAIPGFRQTAGEIGNPGHPPTIHRFASSAAHVMGKPLASAETFTWLREHFHESPAEMKPEIDALFLAGINHLFYHGNAYSPADVPWPGWLFYASSQLNPRNPLWRDLGDGLNAYITRCQSLLQAGQPDNDLLVFWPADDLWHNPEGRQLQLSVQARWLETSPCGKLMGELDAQGYTYDLISDAQLTGTQVDHGTLKTAGGNYRAILVPPTVLMTVETLQRLLSLANDGATLLFVGQLPADVPGFGRLAERRTQFQAGLARLVLASDKAGVRTARLGQGRVVVAPLPALLKASGAVREPMVDAGLQFIRRRFEDGHVYFLANLTSRAFAGWVRLSRPAGGVLLMNPLNGDSDVATSRQRDGATEVLVQIAPGESRLLKAAGPDYEFISLGDTFRPARPSGQPVTLHGEWKVTAVRGGPELPPAFVQHGFGSWTTQGGEWERFAGTARYETEFTLPAGTKADDWQLDLGDLRETARVFVNGTATDLVWSLPMQTRIGRFLKPGQNTLALDVTNLAANRIRDLDQRKVEWKKFHEINFVNIFYQAFDASTWPLQPSGLLGPVRLVPLKVFTPE
jgi:hypothetical protein